MVPRKLHPLTDMARLKKHFAEDINGEDRRLRFGITLPLDIIDKYIDKSIYALGVENQWFVVEDNGKVVGSCHVSVYDGGKQAEIGLTVSPAYRNKHLGSQLFERGTTWARSRGISDVFMHCLSENKAVQRIALNHNMAVFAEDYSEKTASAKLDGNVLTSIMEDRILEQIALYDMVLNRYLSFFNNTVLDNKD